MNKVSIVIPAKNEAEGLKSFLPSLSRNFPEAEIIVVDDGSRDDTRKICEDFGIKCISHLYSKGNGAAIKTGARSATGDVIVFMDADGQHDPQMIHMLLEEIDRGFDMVIGARDKASQANFGRLVANAIYNKFASLIVNHQVLDLTSGFRAVKSDKFRQFMDLYPNGFSYPTTCTMAFYRSGYAIGYVPIRAAQRIGRSHIHIIKDGIRFLLILFKVGTLYSPLKIFVPASFVFFLMGLGHYMFTFFTEGRFTNMSALLFINSIIIFLIGLVSEQITAILYSHIYKNSDE